MKKTNCPNCGAPIQSEQCPYCGTMFVDVRERRIEELRENTETLVVTRNIGILYAEAIAAMRDFGSVACN